MKALIQSLLILSTSSFAFAVPGSFKLISPSSVKAISEKKLEIKVKLPCSNEYAMDWSRVVTSHDDSGDQVVAVGVVVPMSECTASVKGKLKSYSVDIDPSSLGFSSEDEFQPMEVAP